MKTLTTKSRIAVSLLAAALMAGTGLAETQQYYQQGPPPPPPPQQHGWETPPPQFAAAFQRGYKDGVFGARRDFENHRPPSPMNRDEYRNPHFIAPPDRHDYRDGFRRGYEAAVQNMYGHDRRGY